MNSLKNQKETIAFDMENNELALAIVMNAPFGEYVAISNNENVILANNGNYKPIAV